MKTILVTGANGLLGQKLIYALKGREDVHVIATSIGENRILDKEGYLYESFDVTDVKQTENILKKYQPDTIINTAAMTNVDACEADKEACWKLNVTAVENIISACNKYNKNITRIKKYKQNPRFEQGDIDVLYTLYPELTEK